MNKSALKSFATSARRELLERIELQARKVGITSESIQQAQIESSDAIFIDGKQLSEKERVQRNKLITRIRDIGFDRVMEEVAYTWFNRFTALRFMEVNDYLPTKVRVLSSINVESAEPDMMKEALSLNLNLDKEYVYQLKMSNNNDELFKYLIIKHCNDLNRYMPFMFETIDDYTEILFPEGLLSTDSFVRQMTKTEIVPEEDWGKVEIIGWLYQYYISEENERVIQAKKRYKAEELPFATQLFTPEWIVRYMVQNALGRYWVESHPEDHNLVKNWEFYLENPNADSTFEENLAPYINKELKVEEIKCFDPAMGSGHILVYMFDVLHEIYSKSGYMEKEIPRLIIENNLYGLDIDDRAFQLASFSVVMKAMEYNKRFLRSIERDGLTMNLAALQETNTLKNEEVEFLAGEPSGENYENMKDFVKQFHHAKAIGSLIKLQPFDKEWLSQRMKTIEEQSDNLFELDLKDRLTPLFHSLIKQANIMDQQYDIFITNPPYAGNKYVTAEVSKYLLDNYSEVKSDLFSAFIEYSFSATKENGQIGFMSPFVWMFISSFEKLRNNIINNRTISSLIQLEYSGFDGATVPICTFTMRNFHSKLKGEYVKLSDFRGAINQPNKTIEAVRSPSVSYRYSIDQEKFKKIPGSPIAFWATNTVLASFDKFKTLNHYGQTRKGMVTADNNRFVRQWSEVDFNKIGFKITNRSEAKFSSKKWFPYNKGGSFRKWFGNNDDIINWENDGEQLLNMKGNGYKVGSTNHNLEYIFKPAVTWNKITSSKFSATYSEQGFLFDDASPFFSIDDENQRKYILAILCSEIGQKFLTFINPTLNFQPGNVSSVPIAIVPEEMEGIIKVVDNNIEIAKKEWNSYETSFEFNTHPYLVSLFKSKSIRETHSLWEEETKKRFNQMKKNEVFLNKKLVSIYQFDDEVNAEINDEAITLRTADIEKEVKSFISYAVGCMFGRYSLNSEGVIYAGGVFESSKYEKLSVDHDNIIPLLFGAYFEDDIISNFVDFLRVTFGKENFDDNYSRFIGTKQK